MVRVKLKNVVTVRGRAIVCHGNVRAGFANDCQIQGDKREYVVNFLSHGIVLQEIILLNLKQIAD